MNITPRFFILVALLISAAGIYVGLGASEARAQEKPGTGWTLKYSEMQFCPTCSGGSSIGVDQATRKKINETINQAKELGMKVEKNNNSQWELLDKDGKSVHKEQAQLGDTDSTINNMDKQLEEVKNPGSGSGTGEQNPGDQEPQDVCYVVAPGWSTDKKSHSIPPQGQSYGTCYLPGERIPFDCPHEANAISFIWTITSSPNYRLYHRQAEDAGGTPGRDRTLAYQVQDAQSKAYGGAAGDANNITFVIPNKEQAMQYVASNFKTYTEGQVISPGPYIIGKDVKEKETGNWVKAVEGGTNGCTFQQGKEDGGVKPPNPMDPDNFGGPGGPGGPGEGGALESLLPMLTGLLEGLLGQGGQQTQPSPSPSPLPEEDSPFNDPDTLQLINEELDRVSKSGASEEDMQQIGESVMEVILNIFRRTITLSETRVP